METKPKIGLIGLGIMGRPMARNLLKAGYSLTVYDVVPEAVAALAADGAKAGATPAAVAASSDVLITIVPDSPQVREVYLGPDGAFEALRPGWLAIDMSSIAPSTSRELATKAAAAGAEILDAPVSGGDKGAIAGTLSIMVGGSAAGFERALPILRAMGRTIVHCGPAGAGQVVCAGRPSEREVGGSSGVAPTSQGCRPRVTLAHTGSCSRPVTSRRATRGLRKGGRHHANIAHGRSAGRRPRHAPLSS